MDAANSSWTKPKQTFKIKKSSANRKSFAACKEIGNSPLSRSLTEPQASSASAKRRNPFSKPVEEVKRQKLADNFFLSPDSEFALSSDSKDSGCASQDEDLFRANILSTLGRKSQIVEDDGFKKFDDFPLDWTLKSRAVFSATENWKWREHLSTVETASSVTGGVRCLDIASGEHYLDTSASTQFHSACLYWQHPTLPGLSLFPRFGQSKAAKVEKLGFTPEMHRLIQSEWMNSLQSLYPLVKAGQCPYFYVCAPTFTCLFRAAGISGSQQILALMTPTTSGLRAALTREEVEFSLPLQKPHNQDETAEGNDKPDTSAVEFLESLGIDTNSLPGFSMANPKSMTQTEVLQDNKGDSLICVEGVECQSLINYLLNAKLTQGPNCLPPTILSPVAFPGAVLKSLKVTEHVVSSKNGQPKTYQINLQGPILPSTLEALTLLSVKHAPTSRLRTTSLEDTTSLSHFTLPPESVAPTAFGSATLKDCGLLEPLLKQFCKVRTGTEMNVLREVEFRNGNFKVLEPELE